MSKKREVKWKKLKKVLTQLVKEQWEKELNKEIKKEDTNENRLFRSLSCGKKR